MSRNPATSSTFWDVGFATTKVRARAVGGNSPEGTRGPRRQSVFFPVRALISSSILSSQTGGGLDKARDDALFRQSLTALLVLMSNKIPDTSINRLSNFFRGHG